MTRFLQPEWFWLLALLPLVMLWRGRRGPVAAIEYSDVGLAREVARRSRSRIGRWVWLLPIIAGVLMIVGLARPQRTHSRTEVTANGIDIVLGLDVSGSMQALDFMIDNRRVNRIEVVKSVVSKFIESGPTIASDSLHSPGRPTWSVRSRSITTGCSKISSASASDPATTARPSARPSPPASTGCA